MLQIVKNKIFQLFLMIFVKIVIDLSYLITQKYITPN